jgi:hypothetical protein
LLEFSSLGIIFILGLLLLLVRLEWCLFLHIIKNGSSNILNLLVKIWRWCRSRACKINNNIRYLIKSKLV